jgi:hypothetical protein
MNKEIDNATLKAFLAEPQVFETIYEHGPHVIKTNFMGETFIFSDFGSWYPVRFLREI